MKKPVVGDWGRENDTDVGRAWNAQTLLSKWVPPCSFAVIFPITTQQGRYGKDCTKDGEHPGGAQWNPVAAGKQRRKTTSQYHQNRGPRGTQGYFPCHSNCRVKDRCPKANITLHEIYLKHGKLLFMDVANTICAWALPPVSHHSLHWEYDTDEILTIYYKHSKKWTGKAKFKAWHRCHWGIHFTGVLCPLISMSACRGMRISACSYDCFGVYVRLWWLLTIDLQPTCLPIIALGYCR